MTCTHTLADMDTAAADGLCALCLRSEVARLRGALRRCSLHFALPFPEEEVLERRSIVQEIHELLRPRGVAP